LKPGLAGGSKICQSGVFGARLGLIRRVRHTGATSLRDPGPDGKLTDRSRERKALPIIEILTFNLCLLGGFVIIITV
jgi:hypothetical protein